MFGGLIPAFYEFVDVNTVHVVMPLTPTIFLCGGDISHSGEVRSLRGAFLRFAYDKPFDKYEILIAEELNAFFPRGTYRDLLLLESDLAQIATLIVVFSESYGSAAELGAFAMNKEIAERLLVIIDDKNYRNNSFIKLGPLKSLENNIGRVSVHVLDMSDLGISSLDNLLTLNVSRFKGAMLEALSLREASIQKTTTFVSSNRGHLAVLMTALVQLHGALTDVELKQCLKELFIEVDSETVTNLMLCAEFVRWIVKVSKGSYDYYISNVENQLITYRRPPRSRQVDPVRWRADVLAYWNTNDRLRFKAISDVRAAR